MRRHPLVLASALFFAVGAVSACSSGDAAKPKAAGKKTSVSGSDSKKPDIDDDDDSTTTTTSSTACMASPSSGTGSASTTGSADDEDSTSLMLTGPGFDTVSAYLTSACGGCHPGAGKEKTADYGKFADAKKFSAAMLIRMSLAASDGKFMPAGADKDSAQLAKVKAWVDGGMQPAAASASTSPCGDTTPAPTDGTGTAPTSPFSTTGDAALDALIEPAEKQTCHNQGKPFNRKENACYANANLPTDFKCTKAEILTKLNNSAATKAAIDGLEAAGKSIEDCGITTDGHVLIAMYCFAVTDTQTCLPPDKITGSSVSVLVSKIEVTLPK